MVRTVGPSARSCLSTRPRGEGDSGRCGRHHGDVRPGVGHPHPYLCGWSSGRHGRWRGYHRYRHHGEPL